MSPQSIFVWVSTNATSAPPVFLNPDHDLATTTTTITTPHRHNHLSTPASILNNRSSQQEDAVTNPTARTFSPNISTACTIPLTPPPAPKRITLRKISKKSGDDAGFRSARPLREVVVGTALLTHHARLLPLVLNSTMFTIRTTVLPRKSKTSPSSVRAPGTNAWNMLVDISKKAP